MRVFHRTAAAEAILAGGFRDGRGTYGTGMEHTGVWFSADAPVTCQEGATGHVVLVLDIPEDVFTDHEWVEDGKTYREALIPADLVNRHGPPMIYDHDYAGYTREDLEKHLAFVQGYPGLARKVDEIRQAIAFFERHGYMASRSDEAAVS